jgi:hypothetical protein
MSAKAYITLGLTIGGAGGSYLFGLLDKGNGLMGGWSILGGIIGNLVGIWADYKTSQNF